MTTIDTTTAITMTRDDVYQEVVQARAALRAELAAGRDADTIADELLAQECLAGARRADVLWALARI